MVRKKKNKNYPGDFFFFPQDHTSKTHKLVHKKKKTKKKKHILPRPSAIPQFSLPPIIEA